MTKIITCPICGEEKPVRNYANVCSSNCRVKRWRGMKNGASMAEISGENCSYNDNQKLEVFKKVREILKEIDCEERE